MAYSNADNVAKWFLAKSKSEIEDSGISNLKLQKLLYYAQGCTIAITDSALFDEDIVAWQHGPVVAEIYRKYKSFGSNYIDAPDLDYGKIDDSIKEILEDVYIHFGQFSAWKLRDMTHDERPWKSTKPNCVIPLNVIADFFKENYIE